MSSTPAATPAEIEDFLTRVRRSNAETEKFIAEQKKLMAEEAKMQAEARKLGRDASVMPFTVLFSGLTAGAGVFGAGIAFAKLFWP